ncbi:MULTISPECIES: hypothetical protein [Caproicibacterium]|uniref:Uncharacterized protein n=1 Tax=Caproicibacterium lactatifermentans TaxID=2666138 RepID=A0A859DR34_9FIRM|nr:hypothetical protein [Caproicibacterium lactatifermentans]MDD4807567.1 hypothetical protein [Oscillospiraceae bacterium]QKN24146.1 hypothetical protein GJQ69_06420 [Caproicibacterium lactatifermentans]QKO30785.1 hypothetical protein GKP14_07105 [Caproicibacterium lactatifermentans]
MAVYAAPAFAGSDGWTNCELKEWRTPNTLVIAPVSGHYEKGVGAVSDAYLNDKLDWNKKIYLDIYQLVCNERVVDTFTMGKGSGHAHYNYPCVKNLTLHYPERVISVNLM